MIRPIPERSSQSCPRVLGRALLLGPDGNVVVTVVLTGARLPFLGSCRAVVTELGKTAAARVVGPSTTSLAMRLAEGVT
ncbi:MAG: hypothetical protein ABTD50_01175 [Polyangiaceae bacterium]